MHFFMLSSVLFFAVLGLISIVMPVRLMRMVMTLLLSLPLLVLLLLFLFLLLLLLLLLFSLPPLLILLCDYC